MSRFFTKTTLHFLLQGIDADFAANMHLSWCIHCGATLYSCYPFNVVFDAFSFCSETCVDEPYPSPFGLHADWDRGAVRLREFFINAGYSASDHLTRYQNAQQESFGVFV
jgi:hypothetical protein